MSPTTRRVKRPPKVLWIVFDRDGDLCLDMNDAPGIFTTKLDAEQAAQELTEKHSMFAPFRVVRYAPAHAPKARK